MPEETIAAPRVTPKRFWEELSPTEWVAIAAVIFYLFYLNYSTGYVTNLNSGNESIIINGVEVQPGQVLYGPQDFVPQSNVSNTQTFFGIILVFILVAVLVSRRMSMKRRATIQEAVDEIAAQLIQARNLKDAKITLTRNGMVITTDIEVIELTHEFLTRYKSKGNEREAFRYTIHAIITDRRDGIPQYYKTYFHPWTWYWDGYVRVVKALSEEDRCPNCGTEYDEKIVMADDLLKLREAKKAIGGAGGKM